VNPIVSISNFIDINNKGFVNELRISTFSSFFKRTNRTSKDEILPGWNGVAYNTNMVPFWNLVGNFRINPFIFWNVIDQHIGVLGSE